MNDSTVVNYLGVGTEPCPTCGAEVYSQRPTLLKFNGTCSPECARTKAIVDAIKGINYLVPIPDDPEITASLFDLLAYQEPLTWALTYEEPG